MHVSRGAAVSQQPGVTLTCWPITYAQAGGHEGGESSSVCRDLNEWGNSEELLCSKLNLALKFSVVIGIWYAFLIKTESWSQSKYLFRPVHSLFEMFWCWRNLYNEQFHNLKLSVFSDVWTCGLVEVSRRFSKCCCLHQLTTWWR
jgi:hypothetical protein